MLYSRRSPPRSGRALRPEGARSPPCFRDRAAGDRSLARLRDYPHEVVGPVASEREYRSIPSRNRRLDDGASRRTVAPVIAFVLRRGRSGATVSARLDTDASALTRIRP